MPFLGSTPSRRTENAFWLADLAKQQRARIEVLSRTILRRVAQRRKARVSELYLDDWKHSTIVRSSLEGQRKPDMDGDE
jgi:mannose/cellobiose epimerase-like protein (N-acyl-D-glucosamine 2-epimerase family)